MQKMKMKLKSHYKNMQVIIKKKNMKINGMKVVEFQQKKNIKSKKIKC